MNSAQQAQHRRLAFQVAWASLAGEEQGKGTWILLRGMETFIDLFAGKVCKLFRLCPCLSPALRSHPIEHDWGSYCYSFRTTVQCGGHQQRHKWTSWLESLTEARASSALRELISTSKWWQLWRSLACLNSPYRRRRAISAHVRCSELLWEFNVLCGFGRCEFSCASS